MQTVERKCSNGISAATPNAVIISASKSFFGRRKVNYYARDRIAHYAAQNPPVATDEKLDDPPPPPPAMPSDDPNKAVDPVVTDPR
jgi:hypothetical protein